MLVRPMLLRSRSSTTSNPAEVVSSNRTPAKARSFFVTRPLIDGLQYSAWRRGVEMRGFLAKHLGVFDPDDIRILVGAFDKAWEAVQASGEVFDSKARVDTARAILAKHIIAAAKDGERDEGRLRDGALVALAQSNVRSATRPPQ